VTVRDLLEVRSPSEQVLQLIEVAELEALLPLAE
jgi:hypothetical protein